VDEALQEVALGRLGRVPSGLEFLVGLEVTPGADEVQPDLVGRGGHGARLAAALKPAGRVVRSRAVATILLVGVDLFFRGKLDALLPGHRLVTADTIAEPELVIADISRVEPEEVADTYPDIPIVGFSSHTDTAGLRRAHAAGFDQVLAKSALQERASGVIEELLAPVE
jgi:hypothetical protein